MPAFDRALYLRWIAANALAELVGLGSTFVTVAGLWGEIDRAPLARALALALAVALSGAVVEGTAVGLAQWSVLRRVLPGLRLVPYAVATGAGAFLAWAAGMMPSTLISHLAAGGAAAGAASGAAMSEPPLALQLLLAAGMGAVLGPFLGVPQWLVLRRHLPRAGWWVLANVAAWALGMPCVFLGTGLIAPGWSPAAIAAVLGGAILLAGAVVGAVHGAFLVRLLARAATGPSEAT